MRKANAGLARASQLPQSPDFSRIASKFSRPALKNKIKLKRKLSQRLPTQMKQLITQVKNLSLAAKRSTCHRSFLDGTVVDHTCQSVVSRMQTITPEEMGVECAGECPYHF